MARARNIKPGFFKNEDLAECSAFARLCFAGIWTLADREGRLEDRAKRIKGELFAYDSVEVEPLLQELARYGFILRYKDKAGLGIIQVLEFRKHQTPHFKEAESILASPQSLGLLPDASNKNPGLCGDSKGAKTEASPGIEGQEYRFNEGSAAPDSLIPDSLIPDTGYRIPDSLQGQESPSASPPPATPKKPPIPKPDDVSDEIWSDWCQLRRQKKATVTATVLRGARYEATKASLTLERFLAIWCLRGSQGLEASWLTPTERTNSHAQHQPESFRERDERLAAEKASAFMGKPTPTRRAGQSDFIDVETRDVTPRQLG
jgi:hypothetical protein